MKLLSHIHKCIFVLLFHLLYLCVSGNVVVVFPFFFLDVLFGILLFFQLLRLYFDGISLLL